MVVADLHSSCEPCRKQPVGITVIAKTIRGHHRVVARYTFAKVIKTSVFTFLMRLLQNWNGGSDPLSEFHLVCCVVARLAWHAPLRGGTDCHRVQRYCYCWTFLSDSRNWKVVSPLLLQAPAKQLEIAWLFGSGVTGSPIWTLLFPFLFCPCKLCHEMLRWNLCDELLWWNLRHGLLWWKLCDRLLIDLLAQCLTLLFCEILLPTELFAFGNLIHQHRSMEEHGLAMRIRP